MLSKDVVCGMQVNSEKYSYSFRGEKYYFCSEKCRDKFAANPSYYLDRSEDKSSGSHSCCDLSDAVFTTEHQTVLSCHTHLEVDKSPMEEGCNLCEVDLSSGKDRVEKTSVYKQILYLLAPISLVFVGIMLAKLAGFSPFYMQYIEALLATIAFVFGGRPFLRKGFFDLKGWNLNMFTLISLGVVAAYLFSVVAIIANSLFEAKQPLYFDTVVFILLLVTVGQIIEESCRVRTTAAINSIISLVPKKATVLRNGEEVEVSPEEVAVGEKVLVKPGERIPVDGVVVEGISNVDESTLTGEPMPVEKKEGSKVFAGSMNGEGILFVKAERVSNNTYFAKVVELIKSASLSKPTIQRIADRVAQIFIPFVVLVALASFILWIVLTGEFVKALIAAISVLIVSCPCALGIATPVSVIVAIGKAAKEGILIKDAVELEKSASFDSLALDKTGTLTEGKPTVVEVVANGADKTELLYYAASLSKVSEHPLSRAIVEYSNSSLSFSTPKDFKYLVGKGIVGKVDGKEVVVGNTKLLEERGIKIPKSYLQDSRTLIFVALNDRLIGYFIIDDPVRKNAKKIVDFFKKKNVKLYMLTGDRKETALRVAGQVGIENVVAELLPDQKSAFVEKLQREGNNVAMVGDGVNDAPALKTAYLGIAVGSGADISLEVADVVLLRKGIESLLALRILAERTLRNMKENLFLAFIYNIFAIPVAAGLLYPVWGIMLSPVIAASAMSLSSISVILNALRLSKVSITPLLRE